MASADKYGIHDPRALALASLHSSAVDFPKSGRSVQIHDENKADEYPDFMQEKAKKKVNHPLPSPDPLPPDIPEAS